MDIYRRYKALFNTKGRSRGQDAVINTSIRSGVPISQYILFKIIRPKLKVDTGSLHVIQSPCVASTLKFENMILIF